MLKRSSWVAMGVVASCGLATAACGGSDEASKPAKTILQDAKNAASSASSVHVSGTADEQGTPVKLDLVLVKGKGAKGTVGLGSQTIDIVAINGTVYIKGGPAGSSQYVKAPGSAAGQITQFTNFQKFFDQALAPTGTVTKQGTSTVGGTKVVNLKDQNGVLSVDDSGTPYPVQITKTSGQGKGHVTFSDWNKSVTITAPPTAG